MAASTDHRAKQLYEFGPFRVDAEKELLLRGDETVPLTPKTFQILLVLMRNKKEIVTKDELMKAVWPDTFVEEANLSRNIFLLRKALGESPQDHQYIVTVPGRGYRFAEDVQIVPDHELHIVSASHSKVEVEVKGTNRWPWLAIATVVLLAVAVASIRFFPHRKPVLSEKDTIVLADFVNSTGDPVFDGALRQGLAVELEQSPFLSLVSDQRIQQTLRMMEQPSDARLTPEIAREICERTASTALLHGSIAQIGTQYLLTINAASCVNGESLASAEARAADKNHVLDALGNMAAAMRRRLGESLSMVQKFDTPLEKATTGSLEALQAYSMGRREMLATNWEAAVPFFQRAIQLDPNFAIAYARLGMSYRNYGEGTLGSEHFRKAYSLRDRASQLERFYIESHYYYAGLGNLEKGAQVCELWAQTYPRDWVARVDLSDIYQKLGQPDKALVEALEAVRLNPNAVAYQLLIAAYLHLNRFDEARHWSEETKAKGFESPNVSSTFYKLSFVQNDAAGMAQQVARSNGKPDEQGLMDLEATSAAYFGRLKEAREHSRRAAMLANLAGNKERSSVSEGEVSLWEAMFGNPAAAREMAAKSLDFSNGRLSQFDPALTLAISGDVSRAQKIADDLDKHLPEYTLLQSSLIPIIRAQIALSRNEPAKAVELLQTATPYELGSFLGWLAPMYSAYLRGEAYLASHQAAKAAAEFQRILEHRGIVVNDPIGALARLQLGRAYAMSGDKNKAKTAYQDFLTLWKDADSDIPILKQAKAEYSQLQ
jgi:DNA-binding winged helix-turn-helix (wHTH) protein/tetratricopeptide (TPR) repeat protein